MKKAANKDPCRQHPEYKRTAACCCGATGAEEHAFFLLLLLLLASFEAPEGLQASWGEGGEEEKRMPECEAAAAVTVVYLAHRQSRSREQGRKEERNNK